MSASAATSLRIWLLFAWPSRLGQSGDFVSGVSIVDPVLAICGGDGSCGRVIICPDHAWAQGWDRRLIKATEFGGGTKFDSDAWGLHEIDVERLCEKGQAGARRLSMTRIAATSISTSEVCTSYS